MRWNQIQICINVFTVLIKEISNPGGKQNNTILQLKRFTTQKRFVHAVLYLRGDIYDVVDLWSIRVSLCLGVGLPQHVGHTHSTRVFLCHRRLWEKYKQKSNMMSFPDSKTLEDQGKQIHCLWAAIFQMKATECCHLKGLLGLMKTCKWRSISGGLQGNKIDRNRMSEKVINNNKNNIKQNRM